MDNFVTLSEVSQTVLSNIQKKQDYFETCPPDLIMVNMGDFLSMQLPERGFLLEPVIPTQGIVILYAPRGIGKTLLL